MEWCFTSSWQFSRNYCGRICVYFILINCFAERQWQFAFPPAVYASAVSSIRLSFKNMCIYYFFFASLVDEKRYFTVMFICFQTVMRLSIICLSAIWINSTTSPKSAGRACRLETTEVLMPSNSKAVRLKTQSSVQHICNN